MKRFICSMCLLTMAALLFAGAVSAKVVSDPTKLEYPKLNKMQIPDAEKVTLDNGLRIYVLEDKRLPVFRASVRINVGSYLEPADKIGLADICGEVLRTGGTQKWTGDELDETLEGIGGSVETNIGQLSGRASINVLSEYTDLGLEVLSEILRNPTFDEDKIELAKVGQRSSISRRNDTPMDIAMREFRKAIYGPDSPYARHTEYGTVNAITRDDLIAFHGKYFQPENVQIAVWGDFDSKEIVEKIRSYFGDWPRGGMDVPPPPKVDYSFDQHVYYAPKTDVNQSQVLVGHIGGMVQDEDYADRIVMNSIFGGGFGSRLFKSVRSREGLAYATFGSYTANITHPGICIGYASTKSESTGKAIKEIVNEMKRMQTDPPTADEMSMGKDGYLNSFVFNFDRRAEVVNRMMNYDFHGLPEDFLVQEKEKIEKVTPDDVVAAAKRNLKPDQLRVLVVGNKDDFDVPLEELGLGPVTELDITIPSGEEKKELEITPETQEKGRKLLARAVEAHGGLAAFKAVKSMKVSGTMSIVTPNGEFPIQFEAGNVFPDRSYQVASMMGQKMYDIRDGSKGWQTTAPGQVSPKSENDLLKDIESQQRNTVLIFASSDNPDYLAVYDGPGAVGGTSAEFVALVDKDGEVICRLGFDPQTGKLMAKTYWGAGMMGGEGTIEEVYEDIREVGGIKLPFKTTRNMDGQKVAATTFVDCEVNATLGDELFSEPM